MKNIYLYISVIFILQALPLFAVTIRDEDELIVTIKKLHEEFCYYDDIKNYINEHCAELKNKDVIKSLIKNQRSQIADKMNMLPSLVGLSSLMIGFILGAVADMNSQMSQELRSKMRMTSLSLLVLFQYTFWNYDFPVFAKLLKLDALHESF